MPSSRRPLIGTSDVLRKNVYERPRKKQKALGTCKIHEMLTKKEVSELGGGEKQPEK